MSRYEALAGVYDALTEDAQHSRRAAFLQKLFAAHPQPVRTVLDLGCGTGTIACLLAKAGYQVIATDLSEDMLTQAAAKAAALHLARPPLFLHQSMPRLRLLEPVDAAVSTLDSINYLTRPRQVQETFRRVRKSLRPGGLFVFDVNTPWKLRRMDGQLWLDETEEVYCVWRTTYAQRSKLCTYWVDLFEKTGQDTWRRSQEEHKERAWEREELTAWLLEAGFTGVRVSGDLRSTPPRPEEDRWIFRCRAN